MTPVALVLGGSGRLGSALAAAFAADHAVVAPPRAACDGEDLDQVERTVAAAAPAVIINAAALLGIDACEAEPERAFRLNALLPRRLAELAAARGATLVHLSTDAVLGDGDGAAWDEGALPRPCNLYGASKLAGEALVQALAGRHLVCRLSLQFGPPPPRSQFSDRLLARLRAGERGIRLAEDAVLCPSFTPEVAARIHALAGDRSAGGLYHVANAGPASLFAFGCALRDRLGSAAEVLPARCADFPARGRRNRAIPMASRRIAPLRPWRDALADWIRT